MLPFWQWILWYVFALYVMVSYMAMRTNFRQMDFYFYQWERSELDALEDYKDGAIGDDEYLGRAALLMDSYKAHRYATHGF